MDHRADIYALGVVAFELLSGAPPFAGRSAQALMAAHISTQPPELGERCRDAPATLSALVMRCLEKDPARRPQSAAEVLEALDAAFTAPGALAAAPVQAKPSIAVLPFENLSPDAGDEYFADGLTDEIITDLSAVRALHVIARASMMRFKGSGKAPEVVARELNVRYALDGSVRRAGASLRLTARLVDADDGSTIWSDKLGGAVEDVFAMQEKVSRTIVDALKLKLSPQEERRLADRPIVDLKAYEAFLQARQAMWTFTLESLDRARQFLQNALDLLGENARLVGTLGQVHLHYLETGLPGQSHHMTEAERCADRLAALEPDSFLLHSLRGQLHYLRGEIREAILSYESARSLDPNDANAACYLALQYLLAGRDDRAREASDAAATLDPLTPLFQCMPGFCEMWAGRSATGLPFYRKFLAMEPQNPTAHFFLEVMLAHANEVDEAVAIGERLPRQFPGTIFAQLGLAYAKGLRGDARGARALITPEVRAGAAQTEMFSRFLMDLFAMIGDVDAAADAAAAAMAKGLSHYPYLARHNRFVAPLRDHPRFRGLLQTARERWERGGASADDHARGRASTVPSPPEPHQPVVAVLPLANLSASADDEYFSDGMTEDIIAQLSQIASLKVISRTSVMQYKKTQKTVKDITAELGATHIVEGSVRRAGNRLRIVAQLIEATTDAHLWAETFDREMTDVFAIQSEVAERITAALKSRLTADERLRIAKRPTDDLEAYNYYLRGRHHFNQSGADSLAAAIDCYNQAIERDPRFARAYGSLAMIYMYFGAGYWGMKPRDAWTKARALAEEALALNPDVSEAHHVLGEFETWQRYNWEAARVRLERALELGPSFAFHYIGYGMYLMAVGRTAEAVDAGQRAVELDPASPVIRGNCIAFLWMARRYEEALADALDAEKTLQFDSWIPLIRGWILIALGRPEEAVSPVRDWASRTPGTWSSLMLAWVLAAAGYAADARALLVDIHAREATEYVWAPGFAFAYAHIGEMDRAFEYLERAYEDRAGWMHLTAFVPAFDPFRGDPRFDAIVKRVGAIAPRT